jgi:hypothetical protein
MNKINKFILLSFISVLFLSAPIVNALEIRFEGVVVGGDSRTPVGSNFWGSYIILPNLVDFDSTDPNSGSYDVNYSAFFDDSGVSGGISGFTSVGSLYIRNNLLNVQTQTYYDLYNLNDYTIGIPPQGFSANPVSVRNFNIALTDKQASVFSNDMLPYGIPDLNDFEEAIWNITFGNGQQINGDITSMSNAATAVPEPTTMLLLGLGLMGLAGVRRKFSN